MSIIRLNATPTDFYEDSDGEPSGFASELYGRFRAGDEINVIEIRAHCRDLGCCEVLVRFVDPLLGSAAWMSIYYSHLIGIGKLPIVWQLA